MSDLLPFFLVCITVTCCSATMLTTTMAQCDAPCYNASDCGGECPICIHHPSHPGLKCHKNNGTSPPSNGTNISAMLKYADETWNCIGSHPPCVGCATVKAHSWQDPYGCAPYVAHCAAAGGFIKHVSLCGTIDEYSSVPYDGHQYELNCVSQHDTGCSGGGLSLTDYLLATGWTKTQKIKAGTVCAVNGGDGDWTHIILGVGDNICNAHNYAAYHVDCSTEGQPNLCLDPPSP